MSPPPPSGAVDDPRASLALRRRWWLLAALSLAALLALGRLLTGAGAVDERWWLAATTAVVVGLLWLRGHLDENRQPAPSRACPGTARGRLIARWGPGTAVSLLRALALGLLFGFVLVSRPFDGGSSAAMGWWPAGLYLAVALGDAFDGWLARRSGVTTTLGARLDLELDALGTLIVVAIGVTQGRLPIWYLAVGAARYVFVAAVALRSRLGRPVYELPPDPWRRLWAGLQMGFLCATLFPIAPVSGLRSAAFLFGIPTLVVFVRDFAWACGWWQPEASRRASTAGGVAAGASVGLLCRAGLLLGVAAAMLDRSSTLSQAMRDAVAPTILGRALAASGVPSPEPVATLLLGLAVVGLLAVTVGGLPRLGAVFVLVPPALGLRALELGIGPVTDASLAPALLLLVLLALGVLAFGSGPGAVRSIEDRWIFRAA